MQKAIEAIKNGIDEQKTIIGYAENRLKYHHQRIAKCVAILDKIKNCIDQHNQVKSDCQQTIDELNQVLASLTGADVRVEK